MVPHLITALTGPINELEQRILESMPAIERWFRLEWMEHTPPFYTSVDLRNAGFKLAPVDTNLFPAASTTSPPRCCRWRCRRRWRRSRRSAPRRRTCC
jgi:glutamate--cysteine ligase